MSDVLIAPTLEIAQANVLASANWQCQLRNSNLKFIYLNQFDGWKTSVDAGRIDNSNPPQPPKSFVVVTDAEGWATVAQAGPAVCEVPPIPADHSKTQAEILASLPQGVIAVGHSADGGNGVWFTVGDKDTWFKPGKKTPPGTVSEDGAAGVFQCVGAAVGRGWYEKVG